MLCGLILEESARSVTRARAINSTLGKPRMRRFDTARERRGWGLTDPWRSKRATDGARR